MTDKVKQSARQVQDATGMKYSTCRQLVLGEVVFTSQSDDCIVAKALEGAKRWAEPKPGAKVSACRCRKCVPS